MSARSRACPDLVSCLHLIGRGKEAAGIGEGLDLVSFIREMSMSSMRHPDLEGKTKLQKMVDPSVQCNTYMFEIIVPCLSWNLASLSGNMLIASMLTLDRHPWTTKGIDGYLPKK